MKRFIPCTRSELIVSGLIVLLTSLIVAGSRWLRLHDNDAISASKPTSLYLEKAMGLDELSNRLVDSALVDNEKELRWAANILGWRRFQEGHYLIDRPFEYEEFLSKLARGMQDPVSVTILPGRSKENIVEKVTQDLQFDSLAFQSTLKDSAYLATFELSVKDVIGRLFPNTYSVYWTISPKAFFERIINEFNKAVVEPNRQQLQQGELSLNEIITLASIVEWEARNTEEKGIISGLYRNRLEKGMRLQADPTVNFAVGERRRLLYEDYRVDHPYNTYLNRGLPPGPITNPDLSSIKAALYPEEHDYLYMVATPEGEHAFSKTFEEHKQKSAKWREWLQEQYRIKRMREQNSN